MNTRKGKRIEVTLGEKRRMKEKKAWTVPGMVRIETPADKSLPEIILALDAAKSLLQAELEGQRYDD
jgi:hypothetical protein